VNYVLGLKSMKQNITVSIEARLLKRARVVAAERGISVSSLLANELRQIVEREAAYEQAKSKALALLAEPFRLGGRRIKDRAALHDRAGLR
jgi:hypothetical protein